MKQADVIVRGAGVVGQALALSLGRLGLRVVLLAPPATPVADDVRTYALSPGSVALLSQLKVWEALPPDAATAVYDMHVEGDAPGAAIDFSAWDQRVRELAFIVDAQALEQALASAVRFAPHVTRVAEHEGVRAPLTALCEGKASSGRESLGVTFQRHDYGHRAIAARLTASQAHQGVARQWFRSPDVLALLPFGRPEPERCYGLVWSLPQARAEELLGLSPEAFEAALMEATQGAVGELTLASERQSWPLIQAEASAWSGPGWVLLGDAAHVVHPLAGQGLNLGLADVATLTQVIAQREDWRGLGDEKLLRRYVRQRRLPTQAMAHVTDGLLRLFAHEAPVVRELRNQGLTLVNRLSPLKRWLTARALDA